MENQAESILQSFNLRQTSQRVKILQTFLKKSTALAHTDLEEAFAGEIDRATIYRCLKQFLDAGILHRIPDEQFQTKYAVCATCNHGHHHHDHVHFNCLVCNETICLEHSSIPAVRVPDGFLVLEKILIMQGHCAACSRKS
jgi:Fur family ferric uptake transcriptional regulator